MSFKSNRLYRHLLGVINQHFPVLIAKMRYRLIFGKSLNLDNPQNLNEKIQWLSLFSDTTEWTRLADKYAVREFVRERGLEHILNDLYGKWDSIDEIDWNKLPNSFVLKSNNGSGYYKIVRDKSSLPHPETEKMLQRWLNSSCDTTTTEFHYMRIKSCIIAEKILENSDFDNKYSSSIVDYKIWCINGKVKYIWTVSNRRPGAFDGTLFDTSWNVVEDAVVKNPHVHKPAKILPKPANLDEMLSVAQILSKGFPVVRVDLYNINNKITFGEMTFTTHGGNIDYLKPELLDEMGREIDLSNVKKVK